jgi:hypothetical protein
MLMEFLKWFILENHFKFYQILYWTILDYYFDINVFFVLYLGWLPAG